MQRVTLMTTDQIAALHHGIRFTNVVHEMVTRVAGSDIQPVGFAVTHDVARSGRRKMCPDNKDRLTRKFVIERPTSSGGLSLVVIHVGRPLRVCQLAWMVRHVPGNHSVLAF